MRNYESEFRVAYEEAMKYGGQVILGDRPDYVNILCLTYLVFHVPPFSKRSVSEA